MFVKAFNTLKFAEHRFGTRDAPEKGDLPEHFPSKFSLIMPFT